MATKTSQLGLLAAILAITASARALRGANDGLPTPKLPDTPYEYADISFPDHFRIAQPRFGSVLDNDNTPPDNPVTNAGAALGRVLFYDKRLSANDTTSCSSCHQQRFGFSDPRRLSLGLHGKKTGRRSMGLTNARFYGPGRYFWDERAATLEDQVLMPIQDPIEMGMNLDDLEMKLRGVDFYPPLFEAAFGTPEITRGRISRALAQFVRSLVSFDSKFDRAFTAGRNGEPDFQRVFNEQELLGLQLFSGSFGGRSARCDRCHGTLAQIGNRPQNNGLDLRTSVDNGAGRGRFKAPSLRNIAVRAPYMHDGRFKTLRQVIEHYSTGVQNSPYLDRSLAGGRRRGRRGGNRGPVRLNLSETQINALVAFLETLTDNHFLRDPRFADPFPQDETPPALAKRSTSTRSRSDDPDRAARREKLAQSALKKARADADPKIRTAKLMLLVKQFEETTAAQEAQSLLDKANKSDKPEDPAPD